MASRTSIENATQEISKEFDLAQKAILALIVASYVKHRDTSDTIVQLGVLKILTDLEKKVFPIIKKDIEWHFVSSIKQADVAIANAGVEDVVAGLTQADKSLLKGITQQAYNEFGDAIKGVFTSTAKVITMVKAKRLEYIFSEEGLNKYTLDLLKENIVKDLSKDFVALTDKSGRTWKLDTYAEMLARTRLREISNDAMNKRLVESGHDLVQVSAHGAECDLCSEWEGEILSITGRTQGYRTIRDAENAGLMHPNCKHRYLPYHKELAEN